MWKGTLLHIFRYFQCDRNSEPIEDLSAQTNMQEFSCRLDQKRRRGTTDENFMFTSCLVIPVGKSDNGTVPLPSAFAASMEVMCKPNVAILALKFSHAVAQMTNVF
jgi:hypothetical protein